MDEITDIAHDIVSALLYVPVPHQSHLGRFLVLFLLPSSFFHLPLRSAFSLKFSVREIRIDFGQRGADRRRRRRRRHRQHVLLAAAALPRLRRAATRHGVVGRRLLMIGKTSRNLWFLLTKPRIKREPSPPPPPPPPLRLPLGDGVRMCVVKRSRAFTLLACRPCLSCALLELGALGS